MQQNLTLSRAVRIAGITRAELQKKIRSGELETFEGKVAVTDLLRVFPEIELDRNPMIDKVELIKAKAMPTIFQETSPPDPESIVASPRNREPGAPRNEG